ncbi:MAG: hypothetical protein COB02_01370 [Candidatus Cloacimonadota bacterium]|nr:MAG: hypothetical protein COB02_01370 [Candidatus Cloacimonadota bacterium]
MVRFLKVILLLLILLNMVFMFLFINSKDEKLDEFDVAQVEVTQNLDFVFSKKSKNENLVILPKSRNVETDKIKNSFKSKLLIDDSHIEEDVSLLILKSKPQLFPTSLSISKIMSLDELKRLKAQSMSQINSKALEKVIINELILKQKQKAELALKSIEQAKEEVIEKNRLLALKLIKEKAEKKRLLALKLAKDETEKKRLLALKLAKEKAEKKRLLVLKLAKEKVEKKRLLVLKLAKEKAEKKRLLALKLVKEKAEKKRLSILKLAKEKADKKKLLVSDKRHISLQKEVMIEHVIFNPDRISLLGKSSLKWLSDTILKVVYPKSWAKQLTGEKISQDHFELWLDVVGVNPKKDYGNISYQVGIGLDKSNWTYDFLKTSKKLYLKVQSSFYESYNEILISNIPKNVKAYNLVFSKSKDKKQAFLISASKTFRWGSKETLLKK